MDRVLGGFGLQFLGRADVGQPGDVHVEGILAAQVAAQLAQRFQERQALDIANRAAHFDQHNFGPGRLAHQANAALDFVGDMRDDLDGAAQEIAAAFLGDHLGVHLPGGDVADTVEADVDKAFIMAQVEVGFRAVIQHEYLAVLVRAHRARVNVDIGVQFLHSNRKTALFERTPKGSRGDAFSHGTDHAAGKENVFCGHTHSLSKTENG